MIALEINANQWKLRLFPRYIKSDSMLKCILSAKFSVLCLKKTNEGKCETEIRRGNISLSKDK